MPLESGDPVPMLLISWESVVKGEPWAFEESVPSLESLHKSVGSLVQDAWCCSARRGFCLTAISGEPRLLKLCAAATYPVLQGLVWEGG